MQLSGQNQQNEFVDPFDKSFTSSGSGNMKSSVQLQNTDSVTVSTWRADEGGQYSSEEGNGSEEPPKAVLGREGGDDIP